jgi:hypothetical protein
VCVCVCVLVRGCARGGCDGPSARLVLLAAAWAVSRLTVPAGG